MSCVRYFGATRAEAVWLVGMSCASRRPVTTALLHLPLALALACSAAAPIAKTPHTAENKEQSPLAVRAEALEAPVIEREELSRENISDVILSHQPEVRGCHTLEFAGKSSQAGSVTLVLTIQSSGAVRAASVEGSSFDSRAFERCLVDVALGFVFPEGRSEIDVAWNFAFSADQSQDAEHQVALRRP